MRSENIWDDEAVDTTRTIFVLFELFPDIATSNGEKVLVLTVGNEDNWKPFKK